MLLCLLSEHYRPTSHPYSMKIQVVIWMEHMTNTVTHELCCCSESRNSHSSSSLTTYWSHPRSGIYPRCVWWHWYSPTSVHHATSVGKFFVRIFWVIQRVKQTVDDFFHIWAFKYWCIHFVWIVFVEPVGKHDVLKVLHKAVENPKFHYASNASWRTPPS